MIEEKDHIDDASLKVVKFAQSPNMSTYLVAFIVGEFDFVEGKDADGVKIRVYTPKGKAVQGQFALEVRKLIFILCRVVVRGIFFFTGLIFIPKFLSLIPEG